MPPVPLEELLACVDRELVMRSKAYPRWVKAKPPKMTQRTADQEMERMRAVRAALLRGEAMQRVLYHLVEADVATRSKVDLSIDLAVQSISLDYPPAP